MAGKRVESEEIVKPDLLGNLRESVIKTEKDTDSLVLSLNAINTALLDIKKSSASIKGGIGGLGKSNTSDLDARIRAQQTSNKLVKEYEQFEAQRQKKIQQIAAAEEKAHSQREKLYNKQIELANKAGYAYKNESARLNELRNRYKDLAVQNQQNSKEARALLKEITTLDTGLKKIDKTVGQSQREVGNYGKAWSGLKNTLSQVGVVFGTAQLFSKVGDTLKKFDEGAADVAKTTGLTTEKARELSQELLKFDTRTTISELQGLTAAAGSLNIEGSKNILSFVESADKAFVALGDDLGGTSQEIATNVGKIAGVFGDEKEFGIGEAINKVGSSINELAGKSKAAAAPILDFTQRMAGLGNLISSADSNALGAFFDEGGQSVEVAATTLNTLLPQMASNYKKFAETAGMSAEGFKKLAEESPVEALKAVANGAKNSEKGLFNLAKTVEGFGVESARATSIVGFLANNTDRLTELQKISNDAYRDGTSLTDEFNKKNQTLGANWDKLKNSLDKYIISADSSTGATGFLSKALGFVAGNLSSIISTLVKLAAGYAVFIARQKILNSSLLDGVKFTGSFSGGLKGMVTNLKEGAKAGTGLGGALKGIGWTAAIGLAVEFGVQLYEAASGAVLLRQRLEQLQKSVTKGQEIGTAKVTNYNKKLDDQIRKIKSAETQGKITEKESLKRQKEATEATKAEVKAEIDRLSALHKATDERRRNAIVLRDQTKEQNKYYGASIRQADLYVKSEDRVTQLTAKEKAQTEVLKALRAQYETLGDSTEDLTDASVAVSKQTDKETKAVKEKTKAYQDANDQIERAVQLQKDTQDLIDEIALSEAAGRTDYAIKTQQDAIDEGGQYSLDIIKERLKEEYNLRRAIIERQNIEDIDNATTEQEVINARLRRDFEIGKLDEEFANIAPPLCVPPSLNAGNVFKN